MQRKIFRNQNGMVLFVALVFGVLLAAMAVTTSQVTSFATKYSVVNDTYIRAYTQQVSMENDIDNYINALNGKTALPGTSGAEVGLEDKLQATGEDIVMDSDPAVIQRLYSAIDENGVVPNGGFDNQFHDHFKCADPSSGSTLDFKHPTGDATANIIGFCKIDVSLNDSTHLSEINNIFDRFNGTNLNPEIPSTWQMFDWQDEDCDDLPGYGEMSCFQSYEIGQNFDELRANANNLYMRDYSATSRYQDAKNYTNVLPQAAIEIAETDTNLGSAMLAAGGYDSSTTEYRVRITTVGYGGYDRDSSPTNSNQRGTVLSAKAVVQVKTVYAK